MHVNVKQAELAETLSVVGRAVPLRTSLQTLTNVLLCAESDTLTLFATDLNLSIKSRIPATVYRSGHAVLPMPYFAELVKKIDHEVLALKTTAEGNLCTLVTEEIKCEIPVISHELYPSAIPEMAGHLVQFRTREFVDALRKTTFAVSRDEAIPALTGVLLEISGKDFTLVATDGFRICIVERDGILMAESPDVSRRVIIPGRCVEELIRAIDERSEAVEFQVNESSLKFATNDTEVYTTVVQAEYPDYRQVLPRKFISTFSAGRAELIGACERALLVSRDAEGYGAVWIKCEDESTAFVTSRSQGLGVVESKLKVQFSGERINIAFNPRYLLDGLKALDGTTVHVSFTGPFSPAKLKGEDASFSYILLPLRPVQSS